MAASSFGANRVSLRILIGFVALATPAFVGGACVPEEREYYSATGGGGASSSSSDAASSSGGGTGGMSTSSSSSSGNPINPGEIISSHYFPNGTALLFDVAVDANGDSLLAGRFSDVLDFGDGPLVDIGGGDIFLARHSRDDKLIFSKSYGSVGNAGIVRGTVSPKGTMYVTGDISDMTSMSFGGSTLKGPGVWQVALGALGSPVIFDAMIAPGMMGYLTPYSVAATSADASVFVGFYEGTLMINQTAVTSAGNTDGYMIKFDSTGQLAWAKSIGGIGHDNISAVAVDATDSNYIAGYFTDTMPLGAGGVAVTSAGGSDIFVAKLGPAGVVKWARSFGGIGEEFIFGTMAVAPNGDVIVASRASEEITVEGKVLPAAGGNDIFIARYTTDGAFLWAKRYGDMSQQFVDSLAVDSNGNILLTGPFEGSLDFGSGALVAPPGGGAYLAKLDPMGTPLFTRVISGQIGAIRVTTDGLSSILLAGTGSNVSFALGMSSLPTGGVFLTRIAP